ncbi:MAG TPA: hemolysin family protein [Gemmatimonadaceae bacterium]|nr:hemolysin family protein [Gemmatimonadaceae bacterium]
MSAAALAVAVAAALVAACFAAADGALLGLGEVAEGAPPAVRELHAGRERAHRVLSFARVCVLLAAGAATSIAFGVRDQPSWRGILMGAVAAAAVAALVEGGARAAGDAGGVRTLGRLAPLVRATQTLLAPVTALGSAIDNVLFRTLPPPAPDEEEREAAAEQFREVVAAEADVSRDEQEVLRGVFSLHETPVRDVMVPRVDVVAVDRETHWSEVVDRVRSSEHARFPVYSESVDEVVGILYAKDLLPAVIAGEEPAAGWPALVRPPTFIPTTKSIGIQLRDFQSSRTHIAIVVDEYGGTAGLVTIEDILEEIVGEIRDEYDVEEPEVESEAGRRYWVSARLTLDELSELLGHPFESEDVSTVGGLVYAQLGRVPRAGEQLTMQGFRVVVERVRRRRIERVYFERAESPAEEEAE